MTTGTRSSSQYETIVCIAVGNLIFFYQKLAWFCAVHYHDHGLRDNDEGPENSPECIDKWKADIRLELCANDWNEGGKDCTEEPGELK